jgi:hypothetical protein
MFIYNGLTGMKRDIVLKLIGIVKGVEKIRQLIGISNEHYFWKSGKTFSREIFRF